MIDEAFLAKVTVLYVEDDDTARKSLCDVFNTLFKEVLVASNGEDALIIYKESLTSNKNIDVIISDINMPNKSGMELLEEVRKLSDDLPFLFTTAYSDSPNLLNAIKYKVTNYVLKPLDVQDLILQIQKCCKKTFEIKQQRSQKEQLDKYLKSIDKVAIISKIDCDGILTYVNDAFLQTSKYSKNELIGQCYRITRHPDMPKATLNEIWKKINEGKNWRGKIKSKAKDGSSFYVNTTILPLYDGNNEKITEFIRISFSITKEESEKRDFKKKVITNIQENRRKDNVARQIIHDLKEQLNKYRHLDLVHESLQKEKIKNKMNLKKIKSYEEKLKEIKENYTILDSNKHDTTKEELKKV